MKIFKSCPCQSIAGILDLIKSKKNVLFLVLSVLSIAAFSQLSPYETFKSDELKFDLIYNFPEKYSFKNCACSLFEPSLSVFISYSHYWLSDDERVMLIYYVRDFEWKGPRDPNLMVHKLTSYLGNYKRNDWSTPYNNTTYYNDDVCDLINADVAGSCVFKLDKPYLDGYNYCVLQFAQKNDVVLIETYYLFKELDLDFMQEVVRDNFQMIKFRTKSHSFPAED